MKKIGTFLLVFLLLLQALGKTWIILGFELNRAAIAKNQCVNRDLPILQCNGRCVLLKNLKENQPEKDKSVPWAPNLKTEPFFSLQYSPTLPYQKLEISYNYRPFFALEKRIAKGVMSKIFQPPEG